jgi:hypothetical protein
VEPFDLDGMERATVNRFNERFAELRHRVTVDTLFDDWWPEGLRLHGPTCCSTTS